MPIIQFRPSQQPNHVDNNVVEHKALPLFECLMVSIAAKRCFDLITYLRKQGLIER